MSDTLQTTGNNETIEKLINFEQQKWSETVRISKRHIIMGIYNYGQQFDNFVLFQKELRLLNAVYYHYNGSDFLKLFREAAKKAFW